MFEVDYEFELGQSGVGEFKPSDNVISTITGLLKKNEIEQAASLFAAADPEVGDNLILDAEKGASKAFWKQLAEFFGAARDMERAARCAEATDNYEMAAGFHEQAYNWIEAAQGYKKAGRMLKAAEMYERGLAFDKAVVIYKELKDYLRAAGCYNRLGAFYHAGYLFMKVGRFEHAVEALKRVEPTQQYFAESAILLGNFFLKTGKKKMAIPRYAEVVRAVPIGPSTIEVHHRLAVLLLERGHENKARQLWSGVLKANPTHEGALKSMKLLKSTGDSDDLSQPISVAKPQKSHAVKSFVAPKPGASDPPPLVLPGEGTPSDIPKKPAPLTVMRIDFDVLRALPVFRALSLNELRSVHTIADRVKFKPGEIIIEQEQPGKALYVIVSGNVKVEVVSKDKAPTNVATLGKGAALGEMAMVDLAPASARVTAIEKVSAFRFPLDRLNTHLDTDPRAGYKIMRVLGRILSTRLREVNLALTRGRVRDHS